ncbi:MAG: molybdenum cofactor guanylyltransferase [Solirubrobacteraceae bacterium]
MSAAAAGIVLAGGGSARMGTPKAALEWHGSTLVHRVAGILLRALAGPVVVVRAPGQPLPRLPAACEVVEDARADRGPLEGLARGLAALAGRAEVAFVASTDLPLLHPAFVAAVVHWLGDGDDICVPVLHDRPQLLAAAYRTAVAPEIDGLLAADRLRLGLLVDCCRVRRLQAGDLLAEPRLAAADPGLLSALNLNRPEDYAAARALPAPEISVRRPPGGAEVVRAATLARAAATVGLVPDRGPIVATLNGRPAGEDPQLPLAAGDELVFAAQE